MNEQGQKDKMPKEGPSPMEKMFENIDKAIQKQVSCVEGKARTYGQSDAGMTEELDILERLLVLKNGLDQLYSRGEVNEEETPVS